MKTLSVRQPNASLIAYKDKTIEFRTWSTDHRGAIAIHASSFKAGKLDDDRQIPHGVVVATGILVDCRPFTKNDLDAACMAEIPEKPGFAWVLRSVNEVHPVIVTGKQRLFDIDFLPEIIDEDSELDHIDLFAEMQAL